MTTAWSQSKEELISGNGCFFIGYGKKRKVWGIVYYESKDLRVCIARYSTKEKAIKALQWYERYCHQEGTSRFYEFPQEDQL